MSCLKPATTPASCLNVNIEARSARSKWCVCNGSCSLVWRDGKKSDQIKHTHTHTTQIDKNLLVLTAVMFQPQMVFFRSKLRSLYLPFTQQTQSVMHMHRICPFICPNQNIIKETTGKGCYLKNLYLL